MLQGLAQNRQQGLATQNHKGATAPTAFMALFLCLQCVNGGCAWETSGSAGFTFVTGSPTCVQPPPLLFGDSWGRLQITKELHQ